MSIELIGLLWLADGTETKQNPIKFDSDFVTHYAQVHESAGYDRVLIAQTARSADSMVVATQVANCTKTLKLMIAHRPGFVAPTMAARMLATLDQFSGGRVGVHIITAASDVEIQNDGDFSTKEERYERSGEYVQILRALWSSDTPIDHEGRFYRFKQGYSEVKPKQKPFIPVFWGGTSEAGVEGGGACADIYAMGGGTVARTAGLINDVRAVASKYNRSPEFCMSVRVILGANEEEAWRNAHRLLDTVESYQSKHGLIGRDQQEFQERRLAQALSYKGGPEKHLWTGLTEATKGRATVLSLVGTAEQLSEALLQYYDVGISRFLLGGFDPIPDTQEIGNSLIPLLREGAAKRRPLQPLA